MLKNNSQIAGQSTSSHRLKVRVVGVQATSSAVARLKKQCDWIIGERIGQGNFSNIHKAKPRNSKSDTWDYAMKAIRSDVGDQPMLRAMMVREVEVSNMVRSPHLLPVLAAEFDPDCCRLFIPLLQGATLNQIIGQSKRPLLPTALWYMRQTTIALKALHSAGWIHGDVKPENIHVSATGHVTLLDLGFARQLDHSRNSVSDYRKGTLRYLAPELLTSSASATLQSDLFGLGATMFELLTGQKMFPQRTQAEVIAAQLNQPRPCLQKLLPNSPVRLQRLMMRLLAKEPLRRPGSAEELEQELLDIEIACLGQYVQAG
ncbi:MAG: hypothetical protein COA78_26370 [Blastopirellula sp.]|nr:MAG: hypothetical protein COA78_26370 [Blastopirellula sp.]